MGRIVGLAVVVAVLGWGQMAEGVPITIVDTGLGPSGRVLAPDLWLAAEFTTTEAWEITDINGGLQFSGTSETMRFRLYSDAGDLPGTPLYDTTIALPFAATGWHGPSGLSWTVGPGSYWIGFEPVVGSYGMLWRSPSPLGNEAFSRSGGAYLPDDGIDLSVRVLGNPLPVPEPATLLLLCTGLAAVGYRRRRKQ